MKNKRESGEVVVEASIIVTLVFIVISIMFYIGMALYQQTAISVIASRTATNIAQVYSNALRDPFTGHIDPDSSYQPITYGNMKTDAYIDAVEQKGAAFVQYRLKKAQIISAVDREVDVQVVNKPNELLKAQVVVTVKDVYDIPLVGVFGLDGRLAYQGSGRADCVDVVEYVNGVEAIANPEESPIPSLPDSDTCIVTFVKEKYSGGFHAAVPVLRGKSIITSNKHSHSTMPKNPVFNNLKFMGWVKADGSAFLATEAINSNITVYGSWQCTVTFDANGGTMADGSGKSVNTLTKSVAYKKTTSFPTPKRNGYSFVGWYTEKDGGERYYSNVTEITKNVKLYARWQCIHKYQRTTIRNGTCIQVARYRYKCSTCGHTYEADGSYGDHRFGNASLVRGGNCVTRSLWRYTCSTCGKQHDSLGDFGGHGAAGRCGKTHWLGSNSYSISSHNRSNGYTMTTAGECILCSLCRQPNETARGWTVRNGQQVTWGMYCRAHNDRSGNNRSDGSYKERPNLGVH